MNEQDKKGRAEHGYRNEVTWDDGKGRQPYSNQGEVEQGPASAGEFEGGNAGETAGRNAEDMEAVRGTPGRPD